ncbi:hypothetical protein [Shigella dysenteriae]|uniref:hypothetical protein n=1 Tax=Shigella dysenteriae TaxID=622 RepID=UPI002540BE6D|nr:hypothetical protein [Shigella dysenteriae]
MNGIIRLPSGVHHNALVCFFEIWIVIQNAQSLLASLSLHNHLWFKRSKEDLLKASFSSDSQRSEFENKVAKAIDMYSDFEAELKNKILPLARQGDWICPYISRHLLSLNPLQARCRRYSRGER